MNIKIGNITKEHVLFAIITVLLGSNIWTAYGNFRKEGLIGEHYVDSVRATENGFGNIFNEFEDLLEEKELTAEEIESLIHWVDKTRVLAATVTYQDNYHPDLWDQTSDMLGEFELLLDDIRLAVYIQDSMNKSVRLTEKDNTRMEDVKSRLELVYDKIFPNDSWDNIIWETRHYEEYDSALEALHYFSLSVGEAWMVVPSISQEGKKAPEIQARDILIEIFGIEYVDSYFEQWKVERNEREPENWLTSVGYFYYIQVGNYTEKTEFSFHFDKMNHLMKKNGVPTILDIMPFNITKEYALEIGFNHVEKQFVSSEARIYYRKETHDDTPINRYVWNVQFFHTQKNASSGEGTTVYIDPHSGEVYGVDEWAWASTS